MVEKERFNAREARCLALAKEASDPEIRQMYEDTARHYRWLIERGAYDADVRVTRFTRDD